MRETGYISSVLSQIPCLSSTTSLALVIYKIGCNDIYSNVLEWYNDDILSLILQNVDFTSQNIIKISKDLGKPEVHINFLKYHIEFINNIFNAKTLIPMEHQFIIKFTYVILKYII